jgi:hypothetical protein
MNTIANNTNEFVTTEASHLDNDDALTEFAAKMPGSVEACRPMTQTPFVLYVV